MRPPTYQSALLTGCRNFSRVDYIDEKHINVKDWNAVFECSAQPDVRFIAVRPHFMKPVAGPEPGRCIARFKVKKTIDNLTEMILMLHAYGDGVSDALGSDYSELNIRLKKEEWEPYAGQDELYIEFLRKIYCFLADRLAEHTRRHKNSETWSGDRPFQIYHFI